MQDGVRSVVCDVRIATRDSRVASAMHVSMACGLACIALGAECVHERKHTTQQRRAWNTGTETALCGDKRVAVHVRWNVRGQARFGGHRGTANTAAVTLSV